MLLLAELSDDRGHRNVSGVEDHDRVARQLELAERGTVKQVTARYARVELEQRPSWQRLAPQRLVVSTQLGL
jgi:hypothetical protein